MYKALENIKVRVDGVIKNIKSGDVIILSRRDADYLIKKQKIEIMTAEIGYDLYIEQIMCQIIKREAIGNDKCLPFLNDFLAATIEEDLLTLNTRFNVHD